MVWVSNQAGITVNVAISADNNTGGATQFFPIVPGLESSADNYWNRDVDIFETAVVQVGDGKITVSGVSGNDFILIYTDTVIKFKTDKVSGPGEFSISNRRLANGLLDYSKSSLNEHATPLDVSLENWFL